MKADLFVRYTADVSECGKYRYSLSRIWDDSKPWLCWIMLNPSTADADVDDPTIRRCMGFAKQWGHGGIRVVNLFAFRSPYPNALHDADDPIGPMNNDAIIEATFQTRTICAWGTNGSIMQRNLEVLDLLKAVKLECLAKTKYGHPQHPLYVKADVVPILFP